MGEPRKHFGAVLRERRIEVGYSLRKFAEAVEISPTYLSLVETGKAEYPPSAERVRKMAELLDADVDRWIALAGRMPEDVKDIIMGDPEQMPALLRAAKDLTPEQLKKLIENAKRQSKGDKSS